MDKAYDREAMRQVRPDQDGDAVLPSKTQRSPERPSDKARDK